MVIRLLYVKHVLQNYGKMKLSDVKKKENENYSLRCAYGKVELPDGENQRSTSNSSVLDNDIIQNLKLIDIVVQTSSGSLRRISELHPSYPPLQYPLLFPYGDDGYRVDIPHRGITPSSNNKRLFQQFLVDAYTMIESKRLHFIRSKQQILICESYENLRNQQDLGNKDISNVRQRVILPSSFIGGARYLMQNYLDAMTLCDVNDYPLYMRRNNGYYVEKSGVKLDNRNVVPYNKYLLKRYQAHINVEWCNQGSSIKYLFKYINKGPDRATIVVEINTASHQEKVMGEIKDYYDCRYIYACEASWRLFKYDVHYQYPSLMRLPFHLHDQQQVIYAADDDIDDVLEQLSVAASMFTSWIECNKINKDARKLTYVEFPIKFFINKVKCPKSFEEIRIVNGEEFPTFRDACYALGLLDDDKEYVDAIKEASHSGTGFYLCFLFATMLMSNHFFRPEFVWENTWQHLSNDILYYQQRRLKSPGFSLNEDHLKNMTLFEIEQILFHNNTSLKNYKQMSYPDSDTVSSCLITEELDYDIPLLKKEFDGMFHALTNEKRNIFLDIMTTVNDKKGCVCFVYGYGGTGKTFLWKTISTAIRCNGDIVLNVASSGIASLLLPGGRTTHYRFIIPLNLTEDSVSLDRALKDVCKFDKSSNSKIPFGGKAIVFGGDFRQILPVVQGGSRQNIVNAFLSSSYIWQQCKVHRLTINMRLTVGRDPSDIRKIHNFANWLLDIGEGKVGGSNDGEAIIYVPDDILINDPHDPIGSLIKFIYPSILEKFNVTSYFQERAILAPKNEVVQQINDRLLALFPGDEI
ncbi:uncharacterized protein LOC111880927 [Lactuca sativa]|uniref:uncharacterized protein LOC111880927 n=1 Tax=Lactuca sativa TaxID=4236 RepID=UPI000CD8556D|nr:uncharacterized protein LOC111880927 [Lactuca sativa]